MLLIFIYFSMAIKIAINGFGRIGRAAFRILLEHPEAEVVAVNDPGNPEMLAHLLKYDTVYGKFSREVKIQGTGLSVHEKNYPLLAERDATKLPWKTLNVDVVLECTGIFLKKEDAVKHLESGAKKVILSAPAKGDNIQTYVLGVNDNELEATQEKIISNASCTTNCLAPVMKILVDTIGVKKAVMTTVHAYTADQNLVDGSHKNDFRRARAAAQNIIPTTTGAARTAAKVIPSLSGVFDGYAIRVPVPTGSLSDITIVAKRNTSKEEVNSIFEKAAQTTHRGIIEASHEPLVSSDIIKNPASAIVDLSLTMVVDGDLVKVVAWYDNEWGYSSRLVEEAIRFGKK